MHCLGTPRAVRMLRRSPRRRVPSNNFCASGFRVRGGKFGRSNARSCLQILRARWTTKKIRRRIFQLLQACWRRRPQCVERANGPLRMQRISEGHPSGSRGASGLRNPWQRVSLVNCYYICPDQSKSPSPYNPCAAFQFVSTFGP